jgi:formate dehydrogenase major subunit
MGPAASGVRRVRPVRLPVVSSNTHHGAMPASSRVGGLTSFQNTRSSRRFTWHRLRRRARGSVQNVGVTTWLGQWPVMRQALGSDRTGRGDAVTSPTTRSLEPRTSSADRVVRSVCPYCAVGCGQNVYVKDDKVVQIEGDPDSPISRGRLCPKGSASLQLTTGPQRQQHALYRRPHGTNWEPIDLDTAMDMIADRVIKTRRETWEWESDGSRTRRTLGFGSLGGATLDNEENYLIKKLFTALGAIQIENQARI